MKEIREELETGGSRHARASRITASNIPCNLEGQEMGSQNGTRLVHRALTVPKLDNYEPHDDLSSSVTTAISSTKTRSSKIDRDDTIAEKVSTPKPDDVPELSETTLQLSYEGLDDTLQQPWWERVWVIQVSAL